MSQEKRTLFSAFVITFLDNFGYSLVFIMFAPLILEPSYGFFSNAVSEGTKNILLGALIGVFPFFTFFGAPFWGDYGDRFGRKKALLLTILGTVAGHILSAIAIFSKNYLFLLLARALAGFFSGNISICLATISDLSVDTKKKAKNLGIFTMALGIGWVSAMVLGGYLSDPAIISFFTPVLPFSLVALLTIVGYWIVRVWFTETHPRKESVHFDIIKSIHEIRAAIRYPESRPFLFMLFFWNLGWFFTFQWFTPVSLERFSVGQEIASFYLIILGLIWMMGGILLNPFSVKRFSSIHISLFCMTGTALFILLTTTTGNYFIFTFFVWIATVTAPLALSNNLSIVSSSAPKQIQGKIMGFTQSFQALAGLLVPFLGGILAKFDIRSIFPIGAACIFISLLLLLIKKSSHRVRS